jgi:hypothetical protein
MRKQREGEKAMSRPIGWFLAGVLATVLIFSGIVVGATQFAGGTEAQGNLQFELFDQSSYNNGAMDPDPDRFLDDWLKTLPTDCDIVPIQVSPILIAFRCPG